MKVIYRTLLASLTLCAIAFSHNAAAQDEVKSDVITKSIPQPVLVKPISAPATPTKNKINNTPTADVKTKHCKYPALVC
jgi:hypothetical protein